MTNPKAKNLIAELDSTNLRAAEYDPFMKVLILRFHTGGDYEYVDVEREVFTELVKAESAGKYFHQHIRGKYEFLKVTKRPVAADFTEDVEETEGD